MYFWNAYPFIRFTAFFISGILIYEHFDITTDLCLKVFFVSLILALTFRFFQNRIHFRLRRILTGSSALLAFMASGAYCTYVHYGDLPDQHYSNQQQFIRGFSGIISSSATERTNYYRYDFTLHATLGDSIFRETSGVIHLYVRKDTTHQKAKYRYGDRLLVEGAFFEIPGPKNPSEFDFKKYLERKKIYSQTFVEYNQIKLLSNDPPSFLLAGASELRASAERTIDRYVEQDRERGVAKALLLGIKDHIDADTKKAYSSSGAMHVLAVSGLHVGIIFLILQFLFGRLRNQGLIGKLTFACITVIIIWIYALVTGFSPSVLRAATMFTALSISQLIGNRGNIYNTLGLAAFVLLIADPYFIFSVGFQLSFIAVFGIVYLQPRLYQIILVPNVILDKIWSISCVSLAAQLATFPLTAYYFHQFPVYFLISNLLVIPAAFLLLSMGIAMLLSNAIIPKVAEGIGMLIDKSIFFLNECLFWIQELPQSLITWIYLDRLDLILLYVVILVGLAFIHFRSFKALQIFSFLLLLLAGNSLYRNYSQHHTQKLVFYELRNRLAIDHIYGHQSQLYLDRYNEAELDLLSYQINPNRLSSGLLPITNNLQTFKEHGFVVSREISYGVISGKKIFIFDSTTFHLDFKEKISTDFIIINKNAVKSLKWLSKNFEFERIILGYGNNRYHRSNLLQEAEQLHKAIHDIQNNGALIIDIKKERPK
ncbi:MAG: ComEC/Rec2 family competence protein [Bacteroidota bacterium]